MKDMRVWVGVGGLTVAAWLMYPFLFPGQAPVVQNEIVPQISYICRKSGAVFTLPQSGDVVENPKTGESTLVPAVYDARRKKWVAGPPLEVMRQQRLLKAVK